ncbi:18611_t:CDS:2, partial [Racocetra fulgida]
IFRAQRRNGQNALYEALDVARRANERRRIRSLEQEIKELKDIIEEKQSKIVKNVANSWQLEEKHRWLLVARNRLKAWLENAEEELRIERTRRIDLEQRRRVELERAVEEMYVDAEE